MKRFFAYFTVSFVSVLTIVYSIWLAVWLFGQAISNENSLYTVAAVMWIAAMLSFVMAIIWIAGDDA